MGVIVYPNGSILQISLFFILYKMLTKTFQTTFQEHVNLQFSLCFDILNYVISVAMNHIVGDIWHNLKPIFRQRQ